jgi:hypothetical protein
MKGECFMATFKTLPDDVVAHLQTKVGLSLPRTIDTLGFADTSKMTLNENVDVWQLPANLVTEPTNDLNFLAKPTGEWHLQVRSDDIPIAYARSSPIGFAPTDWLVDGVFQSDLAQKIDEVMTWIDANLQNENILVRLLVAPAYQLHAFWLIDQDEPSQQTIVIIDAPDEYLFRKSPETYSPQQFLDTLRSVRHVEGIF